MPNKKTVMDKKSLIQVYDNGLNRPLKQKRQLYPFLSERIFRY